MPSETCSSRNDCGFARKLGYKLTEQTLSAVVAMRLPNLPHLMLITSNYPDRKQLRDRRKRRKQLHLFYLGTVSSCQQDLDEILSRMDEILSRIVQTLGTSLYCHLQAQNQPNTPSVSLSVLSKCGLQLAHLRYAGHSFWVRSLNPRKMYLPIATYHSTRNLASDDSADCQQT